MSSLGGRKIAIGGAAAAVLVAAGLALASGGGGPAERAATAPASAPAGAALPNATVESTEGPIDLAEIEGPAVIHVYASWCPSCRAEAPGFAEALRQAPEVDPYFVAVADDPKASAAFAREHDWRSGPRIDDPRREVAGMLGLTGQPNTVLVDADGRTQVFAGPISQATLTAALRAIS